MPFMSLLTSILIGWVVGPKVIVDEVERNGEHFTRAKLYRFMIRYVVPVVMLVLFLVSTGSGNWLKLVSIYWKLLKIQEYLAKITIEA